MTMKIGIDRNAPLWTKLAGDPAELSMENRAFNYVSIISFVLLLVSFLMDIYLGQVLMSSVLVVLMLVQCVLYYYSRFKKKDTYCVAVYAFLSYVTLIINYYVNSGFGGPTIYLFLITFQLLIAISKPKSYPLWISLHTIVVLGLIASEYYHPEWVPDTYHSRTDRVLDLSLNYTVALVFIFSMTNYLRGYFSYERKIAEERALSISDKNELIVAQNNKLERVNEEKNKLFSIISHDLRSPMDSIRGYLELLAENLLSEDEKSAIQEELLTQTKYTSELLLNILYWSKTQMQGVTVHLKPLQLKTIIEKTAGLAVAAGAKKGVKLTHSISPAVEVIGDDDMLVIVLRNLINNAIKFTPEGGEVIISTVETTNHEIKIAVQDNGIGIPPDKWDGIFSFKTQSTYGTNNEKGIGLGLMLCKEFVEYQHGKIWFESQVGTGTTFFITLPKPQL